LGSEACFAEPVKLQEEARIENARIGRRTNRFRLPPSLAGTQQNSESAHGQRHDDTPTFARIFLTTSWNCPLIR